MSASNRRIYGLIIAAFISVVAAIAVTFYELPAEEQNRKVFPNLKRTEAHVIAVNIDYKNSVVTLISDNMGGWYVGEMDGYPTLKNKVAELFADLANLELVAPKTSNAAKYPELWVNDVNQTGSKALRISLVGKDGNIIANLTVGKREGENVFIRKNNDAQVWLAKGKIAADGEITAWVDEPLFPVKAEQIRKVSMTDTTLQPEEELVFTRDTPETPFSFTSTAKMKLKVIPEDGIRIANAFQNLEFINARMISEAETDGADLSTIFKTEVETENGDIFGLNFINFNDEIWFQTFSSVPELNQKREGWLYKVNPRKLISLLPPPAIEK